MNLINQFLSLIQYDAYYEYYRIFGILLLVLGIVHGWVTIKRTFLFPLQVLRYLGCFIPASILAIFCIFFAPVICYFMDPATGQLPTWLRWFQPVDTANGCYDTLWIQSHPTWSKQMCAWTFIQRNPAYGACATILGNKGSNLVSFGNTAASDTQGIAGTYLYIADNGSFQFSAVYLPFSPGGIFMLVIAQSLVVTPLYYFFGFLGLYGLIPLFLFWVITHFQGGCVQHGSGWQIQTPAHPTFGSYELNPIRSYKFGA